MFLPIRQGAQGGKGEGEIGNLSFACGHLPGCSRKGDEAIVAVALEPGFELPLGLGPLIALQRSDYRS